MLTNRNIYFDFTSFSNRHFSSTKNLQTAPGILRTLVSPHTLVVALLTIAAGILIFRFGTWYRLKKASL